MLPQLLCAAVCLGAEPRATPPDISQLAETISTNVKKGPLKGAIRVYQAFNSLFANSDEAMLAELLAHRDRSIALQSVWRMQRYKPQRSFDPTNRYYLPHFIESEIGIRVPAVWAVQVAELYPFKNGDYTPAFEYYGKQSPTTIHPVGWIDGRPGYNLRQERHETALEIQAPLDTEITEKGESILIRQGRLSVRFDRAHVPKLVLGMGVHCTVLLRRDISFVAFHADHPFSYPLYCITSSTGAVRWRAFVWGDSLGSKVEKGGITLAIREETGPPRNHDIYFSRTDKQVAVFGAGIWAPYVEAFDIKSGECAFRFSTEFDLEEGVTPETEFFNPFIDLKRGRD